MALRRRLPRRRVLGRSRARRRVPPRGIEPHPDPGRCAFVAADWQSCSESGDELVDPSRSQYKEVFLVVNALLDGEEVTVCAYIWVDRDFALTRGWIQGFPKKLGSIWITRTFGLGGPADPGMQPGARFGGTCAAYERRVAEATVTLEQPVGRRAVPQRRRRSSTCATSRGSPPDATTTPPCTSSCVRVSRDRARVGGLGRLARHWLFHGAAHEEIDALAPVRIGRGFRFTFGYTVDDLETVRDLTA